MCPRPRESPLGAVQILEAFLPLSAVSPGMEEEVAATYDAANSFNTRLRDTILSLVREVREARDGVEAIKDEQQGRAKEQGELQAASEKENDARRSEIVALEDRLWKEKKIREEELGKIAEKQEKDKDEVKEKLNELDTWHTGFFRNMLHSYHLKHFSKNHK